MISDLKYKGNISHFSAFKIDNKDDFGFSPKDYSIFKHGAVNIAKKFGYILAERFIESDFKNKYEGKQIVVVPSAYSYIPTASFFMKVYFVQKLNQYLYNNGFPVVQETKINRSVTYREDYGEMSAKDRYNLISGDKFHIDKTYLEDKELLFLDDIKITGTHEKIIIKMLNDHGIDNNCYMLYFAELINHDISPKFENYLNNFFVKNLDHLDYIIKNQTFVFNTRTVKFILNAEEKEFDTFIQKQTKEFVEEFYYNGIGNEYFKFDSYLTNIKKLNDLLLKYS